MGQLDSWVVISQSAQSGCFSVGSLDEQKRVLCYQLWDLKTLPIFRLNASVFIIHPNEDQSVQSKHQR